MHDGPCNKHFLSRAFRIFFSIPAHSFHQKGEKKNKPMSPWQRSLPWERAQFHFQIRGKHRLHLYRRARTWLRSEQVRSIGAAENQAAEAELASLLASSPRCHRRVALRPPRWSPSVRGTPAFSLTALGWVEQGEYTVCRLASHHTRGAVLNRLRFPCRVSVLSWIVVIKVFNFVIAKISATTEIIEFREIRLKFRRIFFRD